MEIFLKRKLADIKNLLTKHLPSTQTRRFFVLLLQKVESNASEGLVIGRECEQSIPSVTFVE